MIRINQNGGVLAIVVNEDICFDAEFLRDISMVFPVIEKRKDINQIIFTVLDTIEIDSISLTYLFNIFSYLSKNSGYKIYTQKRLLKKMSNKINPHKDYEYSIIEMDNPNILGGINYYTIHGENEFTYIVNDLTQYILSHSLVRNQNKIEEFLKTTIGEVFSNASYHNKVEEYYFFKDVVFTNQEFYLTINVIDYGNTIVGNVNKYFKDNKIKDNGKNKISWAIKEGNTTRLGSGGYGLSTLIHYLNKVQGELIILSGDEIYELKNNQFKISKMIDANFPGTIVSFRIHLFDTNKVLDFDEKKNMIEARSINLSDI